MTQTETNPNPDAQDAIQKDRRRKGLIALAAVVVVGAVLYGLYWLLVASHHISTDDAYVGADVAQVTPLVAGSVARITVSDTQHVKQGQILVVLDDADAKLALERAEAQYSQAQRKVRGYFASDESLGAQVASRAAGVAQAKARVASAQADVDQARLQLQRRQALAGSGAVSAEELTQAQSGVLTAQAALAAARAAQVEASAQRTAAAGERTVNAALIAGGPVDNNPEVAAARAQLDQARLDLKRTTIVSPVDGVVTRRAVQVGQRVAVGATLMAIAPIQTAYVDANFKETQLKNIRIGQPVTLTADIYGGGKFNGKVVGIGAGTGAAFALIPAQNASGNWIKIVQRVPVRIALDPKEMQERPLRVGLSMKVDIDTAAR
jgi:membrane fusion protein (multidrug efflux system)